MINYNLPVNLLFGRGRFAELGTETAKHGKRALLVTGRGSAKKSGILDKAESLLKSAGITPILFSGIEPNPLTTTVYKGAELAKSEGCDTVVGIGGGSALDAAKAIAFSVLNPGDLSDYIFGLKTSNLSLPIILAPTTCGTGSEGNGFSVLTNPDTGDKKSIRTNAIIAKASIIDPELMETMPRRVLAAVGFDALCHNMEAFLSKNAQPIVEAIALKGIGLAAANLVKVYNDCSFAQGWDAIAWASTIGGMAIGSAGVTTPHGMEHPVSGLRNVTHGEGLAALTPVVFERSRGYGEEKFEAIAKLLGSGNDCASAIRKLLKELDLALSLSDLGIREEDIPWMADNCLKVSKAGLEAHPIVFNREDIVKIYRDAL
jgi:alcohol dehydrogenase class IV